ncbi:MAG: hypothetical protein NVSMB27_41320 [Ktedonobacteraceae bacterium]
MAQQTSPAQNISADVYQTAATHQLGQLTAVYKPRIIPPGIVLSVLLILLGLWLSLFVNLFNGGGIGALIIGILFLGFGLWMPVRQVLNRAMRVYVFTGGLVYVKSSSTDAIQWNQVEAVWQSLRRYGIRVLLVISIPIVVTRAYRVKLADGRTLIFNGVLDNVETLGNAIVSGTARYLLPKAIASYKAGYPVQFGPFTVSKQGISRGDKCVPWNLYGRIMVRNGFVGIRHQDGRRLGWRDAPVYSVPNFYVFIALVDYVVRNERQSWG